MNFDGIVLINKKKNLTSFDYVAKLKRVFKTTKIGHTGTLDINATGLIVCLIGRACKLQDYFLNTNKEYIAELILGISTDSEDITGTILNKTENVDVDKELLYKTIKSFEGKYLQTPPMYSSKKVNGQKLLLLAKKGINIERKACEVYINDIEILNDEELNSYQNRYNMFDNEYEKIEKDNNVKKVYLKINCSKGTYIRTLCKDIGEKLNINSCMGQLFRTKTSGYNIEDALSIEEIENKINNDDYSFMKLALHLKEQQVVTFGKYETLHLGHQKIINKMIDVSKKNNLSTSVLIIDDGKQKFLSDEQRYSLLKYYGINNILYFPYNKWTMNYDGQYFVKEILINQMKSKTIIVGEDCSFGKGGKCKSNDLINIGSKYGVEVIIIKKMKLNEINDYYNNIGLTNNFTEEQKNIIKEMQNDNREISSSLINELKQNNNDDKIKLLLNRNFNNLN